MNNIIQINLSANWGSTGKIAEGINALARENGFNPYIAWGNHALECSSKLIHIGNRFEYYKHELESRLFDAQGRGSRFSTFLFLQKLKSLHPVLVHLHNIHGSYVNYKMLFDFLRANNIPVVWTLHDCWAFTGRCVYFSACDCKKWINGCNKCPQSKRYPKSLLLDRTKYNYMRKKKVFTSIQRMTVVSVSEWMDDLVSRSFFKEKKHITIHNGIDTVLFSPNNKFSNQIRNQLGIQRDGLMLLGVAQSWGRKGLNDFLELSKLIPKKDIIVLIGLDKESISNLPNNIVGIEKTDSSKMLADYYSAADLFMNLTYEDNYPTTNLEAISCGTPCLTYDTGGSPESVTARTGFVVNQHDLNAILQSIDFIRRNGKDYYSNYCREYAIKHFCAKDRFQEYIDLYHSILA